MISQPFAESQSAMLAKRVCVVDAESLAGRLNLGLSRVVAMGLTLPQQMVPLFLYTRTLKHTRTLGPQISVSLLGNPGQCFSPQWS